MTPNRRFLCLFALLLFTFAVAATAAVPGRLRVDGTNPRWVTNDTGQALVMTGSHTWHIYQHLVTEPNFAWKPFQDRVLAKGHNFTRGWTFEDANYTPELYERDAAGKFKLFAPNLDDWTNRATDGILENRVRRARNKGLYTSIMLFQGWSASDFNGARTDNPWASNPYKKENNSENLDGDFLGTAVYQGRETQLDMIGNATSDLVTLRQKFYLEQVVTAMKGFPNILWEISNESPIDATRTNDYLRWHNTMIQAIHAKDSTHIILASCLTGSATLDQMEDLDLKAKAIAPCKETGIGMTITDANPPHATGKDNRILVADSDHLGALEVGENMPPPNQNTPVPEENFLWAWKYFLRGYHPIFMDLTYDLSWWHRQSDWNPGHADYDRNADALGGIRNLAETANLRALVPQPKGDTWPVKRIGNTSKSFALFATDTPGLEDPQNINGAEFIGLEPVGGQRLRICSLTNGADYTYQWLDPFTGAVLKSGNKRDVPNCRGLKNTHTSGAVLHMVRQ